MDTRGALIVPLAFTDAQIRTLARAVAPITYADREAFADALARALAGRTTIENAELASILGRLQHLFRG
jgi:hypothetical protein